MNKNRQLEAYEPGKQVFFVRHNKLAESEMTVFQNPSEQASQIFKRFHVLFNLGLHAKRD